MVLVDTSVWIDHFRRSDVILVNLLRDNQVYVHPMVIGELACGSLRQRDEILPLLQLLPWAKEASHDEVMHFIGKRRLFGLGVGWVDMNLLSSCVLSKSRLWTKDKSLQKLAQSLQLTFI